MIGVKVDGQEDLKVDGQDDGKRCVIVLDDVMLCCDDPRGLVRDIHYLTTCWSVMKVCVLDVLSRIL
jgi:hypothetical protein